MDVSEIRQMGLFFKVRFMTFTDVVIKLHITALDFICLDHLNTEGVFSGIIKRVLLEI